MKDAREKIRNLEIYYDYGIVDNKIILNFEDSFRIKLPKLYVDLIVKHNAPSLKKSCFTYLNLNNEEAISGIGFKGFKVEGMESQPENIYSQYIYDDPIYGYEHVYSFGQTGEGNFICFDYREDPTGAEPKICIVIHDEYDEKTGKMLLFPVANNFEEFLDSLKSFDEIMAKYST